MTAGRDGLWLAAILALALALRLWGLNAPLWYDEILTVDTHLRLPWGELADSPGVRDYAPPVVPLRDVQHGYAEITALSGGCRFPDCLHLREPQCAVQAAVAGGAVDARRYESYRRLLNLTRQLDEKRGWRG